MSKNKKYNLKNKKKNSSNPDMTNVPSPSTSTIPQNVFPFWSILVTIFIIIIVVITLIIYFVARKNTFSFGYVF
ncbi:MAG: hypothetical protein CBD97_01975 [Pelagibacteraceae bacterium TMED237]|nr:MAG: hypothetical protein CBD97_01975 [Pelagibacteraceae bacterium TMED237]|tara:strand:+ start:526 stop:747 length:222 start_codon:yes stop_codon:yes gene_type:complete